MGDGFADERGESGGIDIRGHASDHISFAADSANDRRLAGTDTASSAAFATLIPMPVFCQTADESFIDFDNSAELIDIFHKRGSDLVAHEPSGFIGTEAHITENLQSTHALFAGQHQVNDASTQFASFAELRLSNNIFVFWPRRAKGNGAFRLKHVTGNY